jgi:hypothetical protein
MMNELLPSLSALFLLSAGCSASVERHDIEVQSLPGNGEARELDFLNAIYPLRGNAVTPLDERGMTSLAVTRWQDVVACSEHEDFFGGKRTICPGHPSTVQLRLMDASCDDGACEITPTSGDAAHETIVLAVKSKVPSPKLRVRVQEIATGVVHEDATVLPSR